jgi:hypothetical protein
MHVAVQQMQHSHATYIDTTPAKVHLIKLHTCLAEVRHMAARKLPAHFKLMAWDPPRQHSGWGAVLL